MLGSGTQLGQYQIVASIGAGGMGEVYRARDSKLGRDVAIKLLPDLYAHDPERLARFQREAQLLASLSHPNIGVIYDLQESGGKRYLVLELIEGESLAQRLLRGPLPIDESIDIARQVADALAAAHEKNVLHRDLKPANIQLGVDGRTRVLDFGLAKILEPDPDAAPLSNSPTVGLDRTGQGVILGTVAYMSPEQARGRTVDKRTDIWAFGCVLYEMLTAKQTFSGESVADIIASIVKTDPDWTCLPPGIPATLRLVLDCCLRKNAKQRLHEIADASILLEAVKQEPAAAVTLSVTTRPRTSRAAIVGLIVLFALAGFAAARFIGTRSANRGPFTQLTMDLRPADDFGARPHRTAMAVSPDGRTIIFRAVKDSVANLYRRSLDEGQATAIPGTEGGDSPFLSPDGQWIGFWADGKLRKIPLNGGPTAVICDVTATFGVHWGDGDIIVFSDGNVISSVSAAGGTPKPIIASDSSKSQQDLLPQLLPGGKEVLFTSVMQSNWDEARIIAQNLVTGEKHVVIQGGADARYLKSGYLVYLEAGKLLGVSFDLAGLKTSGSAVALIDGVMQATNTTWDGNETGAGQFFVSESGTLAYVTGDIEPNLITEMDWVNRKGEAQALSKEGAAYFSPRLSPDGVTVAFLRWVNNRKIDIWTISGALGAPSRLTFENGNYYPIWAPESKRLVYSSTVSGVSNLYLIPASGGSSEQLAPSPLAQFPSSWSAAVNAILYLEAHEQYQIWVLPMEGERKPKPYLQLTNFHLYDPEFSPDGRWISYTSNESGTNEIYVRHYPDTGETHRISTSGGKSSAWSRNGHELFYLVGTKTDGTRMMAVDVTTSPTFTFGPPKLLFEGNYGDTTPIRGWDVSADGQRFLMVHNPAPEKPTTEIHLILNWTQELQRRVGR